MYQSKKILSLAVLSSMLVACGNPVRETGIVAMSPPPTAHMSSEMARKMVTPSYIAAIPAKKN